MTNPSVQPDRWAAIAVELERIARDVRDLIGQPAPGLFALDIHPHNADGYEKNTAKNRPKTVAAIDTVASVLLGKPGETYSVSGGFHHGADGKRGPVSVHVYNSVAGPDEVDAEDEIARLREENTRLRAALTPDDVPAERHAEDCPGGDGPCICPESVE